MSASGCWFKVIVARYIQDIVVEDFKHEDQPDLLHHSSSDVQFKCSIKSVTVPLVRLQFFPTKNAANLWISSNFSTWQF